MEEIEMKAFEELSLGNYKRWMVPLVDDVLQRANIKKGTIADIGCGPGLLSKELASRSRDLRVVGIDVSPVALRLARKNCKGLSNVSFKIGDVNKLPFKDRMFDIVICKDSFHHFGNPHHALCEMLRITKPNGMIYLQDLRRDLPYYLLKRAIPRETVIQKLQYYSTRASYTKNEVKKFFSKAPVRSFIVRTRQISDEVKRKYTKLGIDTNQLKESFQARYIALAIKNK